MKTILFCAVVLACTGCGDSGNYNRGYVISKSHLDDTLEEVDPIDALDRE